MPRSTLPRRLFARRSLLLGLAGVTLSVACGEIAGNPTPTPGKPSPSPSPAPSPSPSPAPARSALLPTPLPSPVLLASPPPLPSPSPSPLPISLRPPGLIAVERRGQILLVDPERAQPTRILVSSPDNSTPRWSPDARSVLVLGGTGTGAELQTVPATGGSPRRVTSNSRSERGAVFSRRGDRLAYALPRLAFGPGGAEDPSDPEEIWVVSLTSGEERRLASGFDPAWSPDGRLLAYATNGQRDERGARDNGVRVVEVDGSSDWPAVALVDLPGDLLAAYSLPFKPAPLRLRAPSWSPDGQRLVASADGHTSLAWTFDERGQGLRPWTPAFEGGIGRARWSPDGTRLAIESRPATGVDVVVIVELATGREVRIGGPQAGFQAASPTWAPDARRLAVIASTLPARRGEPQTTALRLFGQDGSDLGELLSEPGLRDPDWGRTP